MAIFVLRICVYLVVPVAMVTVSVKIVVMRWTTAPVHPTTSSVITPCVSIDRLMMSTAME